MSPPIPLAYFITFTCYGTRLHGNEAGSADSQHNVFGTPFLPPQSNWVRADGQAMKHSPYELNSARRSVVLEAIRQVCIHRGWKLRAAHVRSSHVHLVVTAETAPEKILADVKAYASRALNQARLDPRGRRRWAHHGSTRYLWKPKQVAAAMEYVVWGQGNPMAVWRKQDETLE